MTVEQVNPLALFQEWYHEACIHQAEANSMCLATVSADGGPSMRMVLMKGVTDEGLHFFTNYESRKADDIAENPYVAACFYWPSTERQIKIEGRAEKLEAAVSDAYYATRPYISQLGAWASLQSRPMPYPNALQERLEMYEKKLGNDLKRPPHWGGYLLRVNRIEFWRGHPNRLHNRTVYSLLVDGAWTSTALYP